MISHPSSRISKENLLFLNLCYIKLTLLFFSPLFIFTRFNSNENVWINLNGPAKFWVIFLSNLKAWRGNYYVKKKYEIKNLYLVFKVVEPPKFLLVFWFLRGSWFPFLRYASQCWDYYRSKILEYLIQRLSLQIKRSS